MAIFLAACGGNGVGDQVKYNFVDSTTGGTSSGWIACTLISVNQYQGSQFGQPGPGDILAVFHVKIEAGEPVPGDLAYDFSDFSVQTQDGRVITATDTSSASNGFVGHGGLGHGWPTTVEGDVVIEVPQGQGFTLLWHPEADVIDSQSGQSGMISAKWDISSIG